VFNMGFSEMLIIAAIALIFIGPKQLPGLAKTLGKTIADLKKAMEDVKTGVAVNLRDDDPVQENPQLLGEEAPLVEAESVSVIEDKTEPAIVQSDVLSPDELQSKVTDKKDET
jgi:sec-independent protein translocase protein TatB